MIKIKELRIGNRILDPYGKEAVVMKIDSRGAFSQGTIALSSVNGDYKWESFNLNSHPCMPITLTEELLVRMGGKIILASYMGSQATDCVFILHRYLHFNDGVFVDFHTNVKLPYAHTLQNFIFALTGKELEIKEVKDE